MKRFNWLLLGVFACLLGFSSKTYAQAAENLNLNKVVNLLIIAMVAWPTVVPMQRSLA